MSDSHSQRIFLAHAREDKPRVRELYDQLKDKGFSPWLDEVDLIGGQQWDVEIRKAIHNATVFLACLSNKAVGKQGYIQKELRYALASLAERPPASIYLIPVRLDNCQVPDLQRQDFGLSLRGLHWVDLFEEGGFEKLLEAIEQAAPARRIFSDFEIFKDIDAPWCPEMVMIPAGTFMMGSPDNDSGRRDDEGPQHKVTISQPFALGRYAITFDEYDYFCSVTGRENPKDGGQGRGRCPVVDVSQLDAVAYCGWLSKITMVNYQLPTEAMWEYACRAETTTPFSSGSNITTVQANYDGDHPYAGATKGKNRGKAVPVGSLPPNPWGLCEMHGNVLEWCKDGHREYARDSMTDPVGPLYGIGRVLRGGSWAGKARDLRSAARGASQPSDRYEIFGFRCARIGIQ